MFDSTGMYYNRSRVTPNSGCDNVPDVLRADRGISWPGMSCSVTSGATAKDWNKQMGNLIATRTRPGSATPPPHVAPFVRRSHKRQSTLHRRNNTLLAWRESVTAETTVPSRDLQNLFWLATGNGSGVIMRT